MIPARSSSIWQVALAIGGDCAADLALRRAEPGVFGSVASDPTVSRLIAVLAADARKALSAIGSARAHAQARAWKLAGSNAVDHQIGIGNPVIIDLDATLTDAHSEKQHAAPTFKREFGFHSLWSFIDHGPGGTGEPAAAMLRPGNAGSDTAADHKQVLAGALAQLPGQATSVPVVSAGPVDDSGITSQSRRERADGHRLGVEDYPRGIFR